MKRFFFLQTEFSYGLLFLMLVAFIKFDLVLEIPVLLIGSFILFIFRRSPVHFVDTLKNDGEFFLSPIHGKIESVRHSISTRDLPYPCHEIRISMSFWDEKGLYAPTVGEVSYLKASKGMKIYRGSPSNAFYGRIDELAHTDFILTSKNKTTILMRFIDCTLGKRPTIWLKSGDRGRGGACFGYYPFGGTLITYIPATSDILVFENEQVVPGQTVIAALKDQTKV